MQFSSVLRRSCALLVVGILVSRLPGHAVQSLFIGLIWLFYVVFKHDKEKGREVLVRPGEARRRRWLHSSARRGGQPKSLSARIHHVGLHSKDPGPRWRQIVVRVARSHRSQKLNVVRMDSNTETRQGEFIK
mmetsp:Transcript_11204/g.22320  ORF Transcript_11204/g.22320 Transcript_11204/m.22320 type:complete len:132 (+) Transcript_11204:154-549(+)